MLTGLLPVADAGADFSFTEGDNFTLAGSGQDDDGTIQSYQWSIGETLVGSSASQLVLWDNIKNALSAPGTYEFTLEVTDNDGNTDTDEVSVTVLNAAPRAQFNVTGTFTEGSTVFVSPVVLDDIRSIEVDDWIYSYTLEVSLATNQGLVTHSQTLLAGRGGPNPVFSYLLPDAGALSVRVLVNDQDPLGAAAAYADESAPPPGDTDHKVFEVTVANAPVQFIGAVSNHTGAVEGSPISAEVFVNVSPVDVVTYEWVLQRHDGAAFVNEGTTIFGPSTVQIVPKDNGTYRWRVMVRDDEATGFNLNFPTAGFTVANAAPVVASVDVPATGSAGQPFTLSATATDPGVLDPLTFHWTVKRDGDVVFTTSLLGSPATSSPNPAASSVQFTPDQPGNYTYELTVTDNAAATSTLQTGSFTIAEDAEPASIAYSGQQHVTTSSSSDTTADVTLRATLTDLGTGAAQISDATVRFTVYHPVDGIVHTGEVSVASADGVVGTATDSFTYTLNGSEAALTVLVEVVGGGYSANPLAAPVTVSRADTGRANGAGSLLNTNSGGVLSAADGTRTRFAFSARKTSSSLSGVFSMTYQGTDGNTYLVISTDVTSLFTWSEGGARRGAMSATVDVYSIRNIFRPTLVHSGLELEMTLTDAGNNGSFDRIAFSVWSGSGTLMFGSHVDAATNTVIEQLLENGNLTISLN